MNVKLVNLLDLETNLHYHGLDVSPLENSDNVFLIDGPGDTINYQVIIPKDHDPGTFWYHPHPCGKTETQLQLGLSGAIVIGKTIDFLPDEYKNIKDQTFLLKDIQSLKGVKKTVLCSAKYGTDTVYDFDSNSLTTRTVNGLINPTITLSPGETQLWRICNASPNIYYYLQLQGHPLYMFGRDGSLLNKVIAFDSLLVPPGARVELLVQAKNAGTYLLKTLPFSTGPDGDSYPAATLLTMKIEGRKIKPMAIAGRMPMLHDYRNDSISQRRKMVFSENVSSNQFYINNRQFNPDRTDLRIKLGSLEEWELINNSNEMHVFHIHQLDYQVTEINGQQIDFDGYQDVLNMPPKSTIKILVPFTENYLVGKFVFHCHIIAHEDRGMMQVIEVYK
jgi:FtsP/CotA-like multicopper oxidase with cupredoxin domain